MAFLSSTIKKYQADWILDFHPSIDLKNCPSLHSPSLNLKWSPKSGVALTLCAKSAALAAPGPRALFSTVALGLFVAACLKIPLEPLVLLGPKDPPAASIPTALFSSIDMLEAMVLI
jgi:hypothetical protein